MSVRFLNKILLSIAFSIFNIATAFAIEGEHMNSHRKIVFNCPTASIEEFKTFAEQAKKLGATHVNISQIVPSRWQWELDLNDPYPNWGMPIATIFKIIVPPELQPYLPVDYAQKNFEAIKQRGVILKNLGLKAAFVGKEPAYLPENVFRDHPDWRGPRCEHPRRARHAYYAPCIDQPKVLEIYRNAVAELCRHAPIEVFDFLTNDSGGGICWSVSLYPGQNGPAWCEHRSYADRVVGFLSTIQEGARNAGLQAEVSFRYGSGYISRAEVESVIPYLKPGQSINGKNKDGVAPSYAIGMVDYWSGVNPVIGIPQILKVAEQLQHIPPQNDITLNFSFLSVEDFLEQFDLIEQFNQHPFLTIVEKMQAVRQFAANQVGEDQADLLMEVWEKIYKAVHEVVSLGPDPIMLVGTINQRWITRPLVPFPMELTSEEKDYFRKFQFQANSEEEAADLMNLQGFEMINGYSGALLASWALNQAISQIESAVNDVKQIAQKLNDRDQAQKMESLRLRLKTLSCFYKNVKHTIQYQDILDRTDYEHPPKEQNIYPLDGDQLLREIQNVTRNEIDNTYELIGLLESTKTPLVKTAHSMQEEDVFNLGPNLVEQLKKKVSIMLKHQLEVHRLYKRRQG